MGHESSAAGSLDSLQAVLNTLASQLNDQLRAVLDRTEKLATTTLTIERTLAGELRSIAHTLGRTAQEEGITAALSRLEGLRDSHAELKQVLQQQLGAIAQVQVGLAELSKNSGVQQAEQRGQLEQLGEQLRSLRRLAEKSSTQSEQELLLALELQKLPALLDRKFPELGEGIAGLRGELQTHSQELHTLLQRLATVGQGTREFLEGVEAGLVAHRARLEGAVGRIETLGNQTLERLTVAARELQTGQAEQRQQLAALERDLHQLGPALAQAVAGTEAARGELRPISSTLHQVHESQRKTEGVLPKLDTAVSTTLPQQLGQFGSDVRAVREDLKPLATGLTEIKTQTGLLLPNIQNAVTQSLPDQIGRAVNRLSEIEKQITQINQNNAQKAGNLERWITEYSNTINEVNAIRKIASESADKLPEKVAEIVLEGFGARVRLTGPQKLMRGFLLALFHVVIPAALAGLCFYLLQRGNESMNVKRLDELVAEKRTLYAAEQSCQAHLGKAKLDAQTAQAELAHRQETEKAKDAALHKTPPPPPLVKTAGPRKLIGAKSSQAALEEGGTVKLEGTAHIELTAKTSSPPGGQARTTPEPSKPGSPSAMPTPR